MTTDRGASVSVVIATRDRPHLLSQAVAAAVDQEYDGSIEVLAVFDQATPDTGLERAGGGRSVRVLRNGRSPGLAGARNCGALAATGQFLAFCDDDDVWLPRKLSKQLTRLAETGADTVVSGIYVDYRGEGRLQPRVPRESDLTVEALLRDRVFAAHPSSVVVRRRVFLDEIGLVDEEIPGSYGEDYDWLLRAATHGHVAVVPEPLVRVLWGGPSFFSRRYETIIEALDYLLAKHPRFESDPAGLARIYGQKAFAYAALGRGREARHWAAKTLRHNARERRAYVALLVGARVMPAEVVMRAAHATGRGV